MAGMNPYALPSIIAFALLLVLSLAVVFQNPRDKSNRLLLNLLYQHAKNIGNQDNFEDDFTIMEVAFG